MSRISVRKFFAATLLLSVVLPFIVFGAGFLYVLGLHKSRTISSFSDSMLQGLTAQVGSQILDEPRKDLPTLLILSQPGTRDGSSLLRSFGLTHAAYSFLAFIDAGGRIAARYPEDAAAAGSAYRLASVPEPGSVSFSSVISSPLSPRPVIEAAYAGPSLTAVALIDAGALSAVLARVAASTYDVLGVVDESGRYIACSVPSRVERRELAPEVPASPEFVRVAYYGIDYYATSRSIPGTSWRTIYFRSARDADGPLNSFVLSVAVLIVLIAACASAGLALAWRKISEPLALLSFRIERIGEGRFGERITEEYAPEFQGIAASFNSMAGSLERRDAEITAARELNAKALEEKDLLLREVYHRVKNNLQVISSLLSLQSGTVRDKAALMALKSGQERVYAMSLAHELVYQMGDLESIDAADYADRLVSYFAAAYGVRHVEAALSSVELELERAIPFGLVLGELVTNAFKYGMPRELAPVRIGLEVADQGARDFVRLVVEDSGPGMEGRSGMKGSESLGLSIIEALAAQLGGSIAWTPGAEGPGTRAELRFPLAEGEAP